MTWRTVLTAFARPRDRDTPRRLPGRFFGLVLIALSLSLGVYFIDQALLATGNKGTHGTFTVVRCAEDLQTGHSGRSTRIRGFTCTGTFRPADSGTSPDPSAEFPSQSMREAGDEVAVQWDGTFYTRTGGEAAWSAVTGAFVTLITLTAGAFCLLTGFGGRWGPRFSDCWELMPSGAVLRPVFLSFAGVGVIGAVVFFCLQ
ncbi:hypothetical protein [Streptomyces celluloflavus]|uniref:hypothetical protein n=1 Tax=Streptomyces celluloflavus TaxID=58344 RepID=UPI0036964416